MWFLIFLFLLLICAWKILVRRNFWVKKNVRQTSRGYIFGDNWDHVLRKKSFAEMLQENYNKFPDQRYFGYYHFFEPIFIPKDPDLIKSIMLKDFDHFVNHMNFFPEDDPFFIRNLFSLKDQTWHEMRITLTSFFTTNRLKNFFLLFSQTSQEFVQHFLEKNGDVVEVELKDIFSRFANDIIANIAFGTECNSLKNPDDEFYLMSKDVTEISGAWKTLKFFGYLSIPKLYRLFNISPFFKNTKDYFKNLIKNNIEFRQRNNIVGPDMINLLLEARKDQIEEFQMGQEKKKRGSCKFQITDEDITSQAVAFLFAGFESVSSLMSFMGYELGVNTEIQKKLIEEVDRTREIFGNVVSYETISSMKFMDLVMSESLRKWSSSIVTNRICTKPYLIEAARPDEKPVFLEKGTTVWIPIFSLMRDPKNYPDPDRFDPERFNDNNKRKIHPCTFLPFGYGPRSCIGSRFGLLETKTFFFYILSNFEIVPVEKTQIPLKLSRVQMNLTAENGYWFGLKKRK